MMTRQELKEQLPFITAWANGEEVQFDNGGNDWYDVTDGTTMFSRFDFVKHRLKPKEQEQKRKHYILPLSELDALEITRDMWAWLAEDISRTKSKWIEQFHPVLQNKLTNNCACCSFATINDELECNRCPLRQHWGSSRFACEKGDGDFGIWYDSNCSNYERLVAAKRISEAAAKRIAELTASVKKQPTLRAWQNDEAPPAGFHIRFEQNSTINGSYLVVARDSEGLVYSNTANPPSLLKAKYQDLLTAHYSLDGNEPWLPCGAME